MSKKESPLFMVAQLPFNATETVELNTPMTLIMNDEGNVVVSVSNLKEHGVYENILKEETHFLEIGCGRGYLLEHFYQNGKGRYYGIEPITSEFDIAKEKIAPYLKKDQQIEKTLQSVLLEEVGFEEKKFDYIYSYHVFEHLENPLDMLEFGKKYLKKGGKMIITCPNVEGYMPTKNIESWRCSIVSHRWLPGKSTMIRSQERSSYKIDNFFTYGGYPAPRAFWQDIVNWSFKKRDLGDVMSVLSHVK